MKNTTTAADYEAAAESTEGEAAWTTDQGRRGELEKLARQLRAAAAAARDRAA